MKSLKSFIITFVVLPSLLGLGLTITVDLVPFIMDLIAGNGPKVAFKNVGITFLLGFAMYFIYIAYKAVTYRMSKKAK
ncbi:hypothetical protein A374_15713 [Fictibacillus macauensis ZFHKF-1]|uniref:Uncharacterized protein n=1 Tax=Fictibacillus macauensis ZFHKF-1 TaxID=1196324 RepID=I8AF41_9BACL|nr:hypothetical protein [Fictibacillus macauensis]EIT84247.1 hypothetical protein A374_15713 [Fictibacillus macauensis ZFHKF-1]